MRLNLDADLQNADWTKRTWDLPHQNEAELQKALGAEYEHFKGTPAYAYRPWGNKKQVEKLHERVMNR